MNRKKFLSNLCFCILLSFPLTACSETPTDGNPKNGKDLYFMYNCSACHGNNGHDGMAPAIVPLKMSFYDFKKRLRTKGSISMPYFSKEKINDKDAADIYVFLKDAKGK